MSDAANEDLYQRAAALLEPGDIELHGAVIHTNLGPEEESMMHQVTLDAGDVISAHVAEEDTYIYSGNDDDRFGVNQHHGLTLSNDEFVWECQQLMRETKYDVVIYWEATDDAEHRAIVSELAETLDADVVGVTEDDYFRV
ncbi:DUF5778 family protein [Halocalculus aciditolerans]|uniref:Uncharacterized protein n=1 Tax=Halocalculus aciditolerans TaxID=1383812 RepID=A0A830FG00_9EURY|nr:DUF5778 family protein [Halocalculus aciditolerans]GGL51283.1 hypothetical protein GCM10009039_06950 [Halocalculus aciditolerans]